MLPGTVRGPQAPGRLTGAGGLGILGLGRLSTGRGGPAHVRHPGHPRHRSEPRQS